MRISPAFYLPTLVAIVMTGCNSPQTVIEDEESYRQNIMEWQQSRLERLKGKSGWLNLAGLFWLEEGENNFGSDPGNTIVFPEKADAFCGTLLLENGKVSLEVSDDTKITNNGERVTKLELNDDHQKPVTHLEQGDLAWFIIKRGDRYGIRLRDYKHPRIEEIDHIPAYPFNTNYVVEASLLPFSEPKNIYSGYPSGRFYRILPMPGRTSFQH